MSVDLRMRNKPSSVGAACSSPRAATMSLLRSLAPLLVWNYRQGAPTALHMEFFNSLLGVNQANGRAKSRQNRGGFWEGFPL